MSSSAQESAAPKQDYLFQRLGGEAVVCAAVEDLYRRILSDKTMNPFLEGISVDTMKKHQQDFLKIAFTKPPNNFSLNEFMLKKHEKLFDMGLNETHVDSFLHHLKQTLQGLQLKQHLVEEAVAVIAKFRVVFEKGAQAARQKMELVKRTKLTSLLAEHLDNDEISDVMLQGNDGGTVPACRYLLAVRSPVFRRMLFGSFKESNMEIIPLDFQTHVLRALVEYCFTDDIKSCSQMDEDGVRLAVHLVKAAHYFEIPGLCKVAHDFACLLMRQQPLLASTVLDENAPETAHVAPELVAEAQDLMTLEFKSPLLPSLKGKQQLLLHRMGGEPVLTAAVDKFYVRTLMDETLEHFFQGVDLRVLKNHQVKYMTMAFTGKMPNIDLENIIFAHHYRLFQMGLNEGHFDSMMGHFVASLEDIQVAKPLVDEAYAVIAPLRTVFEKGAARA